MITKENVEILRSADEYLAWFSQILQKTKEEPNKRHQSRLHKGGYKFFYEEIFPVASLLKIKGKEWNGARFRNIMGNQPYDVEIEGMGIKYFEIASTTFDDGERFRMIELSNEGSVDVLGRIKRNIKGKPIDIENRGEARSKNDVVLEITELITDRISKKSGKNYPEQTALIVYFDDYKIEINEKDKTLLKNVLDETKSQWSETFVHVYLIGPRAENCIEMIR